MIPSFIRYQSTTSLCRHTVGILKPQVDAREGQAVGGYEGTRSRLLPQGLVARLPPPSFPFLTSSPLPLFLSLPSPFPTSLILFPPFFPYSPSTPLLPFFSLNPPCPLLPSLRSFKTLSLAWTFKCTFMCTHPTPWCLHAVSIRGYT